MLRIILSIIISILFISCKKEKETLLEAEFSSGSFGDYRKHLLINKDSTFELKVYDKVFDDPIKKDSLFGKVKIHHDTIYFFESNSFFWADKAILKNGFIEFFQDDITYKLDIIKTKLNQFNTIDYSQFPNYAVFPFTESNLEINFFEVTSTELAQIDKLIRYEIATNPNLRDFQDYLFQVTVFSNSNNEIIADVDLFCNDIFNENVFKFNQIRIKDGGNCNVWIILNLTKNKILKVNITESL